MAVSQAQIVDLLYKQAFGVTKTDTATNKSPSNESIPSPLLIRGDTEWTQANQIPATAGAVSGVVQAYTGASAVECTADNTTVPVGGIYPTWKTNLTYWIPSEFGATYNVQVWVDNSGVANPTLTGTQIFADGSGGTGQYYYNYQSGVLNFIGETIPAALTSGKVLYIVGYRYVGLVGVTNLPSNTAIGNLNFTGTTVSSTNTNGNIILTPNGTGIIQVSSALTSNGNITASYFIGNGSQLTGITDSNTANQANNANYAGVVTSNAQPNITSVGTLISLDITGNLTSGNANLGNLVIANYFSGSGNLLSNIQGSNVTGNVTSAVTANFANYAGNVTVNSQPNITSVGTLISLDITGNITAGNANLGNAVTANYFVGNGSLLTGIPSSNTSNYAGTVTNNAQPNITSVGTLTSLSISGNLTSVDYIFANYVSGDGSQLSNITGANVTGQVGNALIAGTVYTNAQPNITSVGTLTSLSVSGNLSAGNANLGNLATANYISGTLTTNSQPNITSVGTLTSLDVSGHMIANTFQMGYGVYAFYSTSVYFATTASTASNQVLWDYPAADLSAIDFTIIATDNVGATRQSCKISAAILGTSVAFNEYGGLFINGGVGSFSVVYNGSGPTPMLELVVTPDSSNLTEYNMLISKYLV